MELLAVDDPASAYSRIVADPLRLLARGTPMRRVSKSQKEGPNSHEFSMLPLGVKSGVHVVQIFAMDIKEKKCA